MSRLHKSVIAHLGIFLLLILLERSSNTDLGISTIFFNADTGQFILENTLGYQLHDYTKLFMLVVGFGFVMLSALFLTQRIQPDPFIIKKVHFVSFVAIITPLIIHTIRDYSAAYCPNDLVLFNGQHLYIKLFDIIPSQWTNGRCWPSAHASAFFWLLAIPLVFIQNDGLKVGVYIGVFIIAFVLSGVQILRGEHFLTHILWTGFIVSFIISSMYLVVFQKESIGFRLNHFSKKN